MRNVHVFVALAVLTSLALLAVAVWQRDPVYAAVSIAPASSIIALVEDDRRRRVRGTACNLAHRARD